MFVFHRLLLVMGIWALLCAPSVAVGADVPGLPGAAGGKSPGATPKSFYTVNVNAPLGYGRQLTLDFVLDEQACKKAHGAEWQELCDAPPALPDEPARDVALEPPVEGSWWWQNPYRLVFTPKDNIWPIDTAFTINLGQNALRRNTVITAQGTGKSKTKNKSDTAAAAPVALRFATPPDAAGIQRATLWVDPGPKGEHGISFVIGFIYPQDVVTGNKKIALSLAEPGKLKLGTPRVTWDQLRLTAEVSAPVLGLSDESEVVLCRVGKTALLATQNNTPSVIKNRTPEGRLQVPAQQAMLRADNLTLQSVVNDALRQEYRLSLRLNAHLPQGELAQAIRVVQLPRTRTQENTRPYAWDQAPVITPEDIAAGKPLTLEPIGRTDGSSATAEFRLQPEPGAYLHVRVPAGLRAPSGIGLGTDVTRVVSVPERSRVLRFLQSGSVLALGSDRRLALHAAELDAIRWNVMQIRPEFISQVAASGRFGLEDMPVDAYSTRASGDIALRGGTPGQPQFPVLDLSPFIAGDAKGVMLVQLEGRVKGKDGKPDETLVRAERFVLLTDLGLVLKRGADGGRTAFVCSLTDGVPLPGVDIAVLGANGLPVFATTSDATGKAVLPPLDGLTREKEAVALTARRGADLAFMPLKGYDLLVDYSRFDTGGRATHEGMLAHVFSQRGVYRPGETLHFGGIVRAPGWQSLPEGLPLEAVLYAPGGQTIMTTPLRPEADGLFTCAWDAPEEARTGSYRLQVRIADGSGQHEAIELGATSVRVEEFQPDTLDLRLRLLDAAGKPIVEPERGWYRPDPKAPQLTAAVQLRNLHGLPAQDRRIRGEVSISQIQPQFSGFPDFTFHNPRAEDLQNIDRQLPETRTNGEGLANLTINPDRLARGLSTVGVAVQGFEPGEGRRVSEYAAVNMSTLPYMLASRPTANLKFIPQGRQAGLEFLALDPNLTPLDPGPLTFIVAEQRSVLTLVSDKERFRYEQAPVSKELARETVRFGRHEDRPALVWNLPTATVGDLLLTVLDQEGNTLARVPFTVTGNTVRMDDTLAPGLLRVRLDKDDYEPGQTMRIALSTPFAGTGLITLEREGVFAHTWFRAEAGDSVQELTIPADFEGRGYINVSLARSLQSPDIYMQPHVYGLMPFTVNAARRDMQLALTGPGQVRPGQAANVRLLAKEPGKALVFAVDEGVLSLTGFITPSPLADLLLNRMLEVATRQAFDLLMPDQRHIQKLLPAFGGDMALRAAAYQNPFKRKAEPPLAFWSGLVDVGPQGVDVAIPVPEYYNGAIRVMAVGGSAASAGSTQATLRASGPIILTPQLPTAVAPGDTFTVSLGVASNLQEPATINIGYDPGPRLRIVGDAPSALRLEPGKEGLLQLRLQALDDLGEARFTFSATPDAVQEAPVRRTASLSVRPAAPRMSELGSGFAAGSTTIKLTRALYPYEAVVEVSASALPLAAVRGLVRYLDSYPYGCTEQLISRAMPYALLMRQPELLARTGETPRELRKKAETVIQNAIGQIRARFSPYQGLSTWYGGRGDMLLTAYAGDFLLAVREAGLAVPQDLEQQIIETLTSNLHSQITSLGDARARAYAVWVLSRHGVITTRTVQQLLDFTRSDVPQWRTDPLSVLLAGSLRLLRADKEARTLMDNCAPSPERPLPAPDGSLFDPLAVRALHTAILARHFPERLHDAALPDRQALLEAITENIRTRRYATFSAAQAVRALLDLSNALEQQTKTPISLTCVEGKTGMPLDLGAALVAQSVPACTAVRLDVPTHSPGVFWQTYSEGFDTTPPQTDLAEGLEIRREIIAPDRRILNGSTLEAELGDELTVILQARAHGEPVNDVAIVALLPGGFELVNKYAEEAPQDGHMQADFVERREDRLIVFAPLDTGFKTFSYRIRAVNRGRFALPPVWAEAMYSQSLRARAAGGTIEVK